MSMRITMFSPLQRVAAACLCLLLATPAVAQRRSSARVGINNTGAPIPAPILNGKRAFISYELGDVSAFVSRYSGGPERAYNEFYREMQGWGRYQLVDDPAEADVIFAIRFVDPPNVVAQLRLAILDGHSQVSLWGFVEQVDAAIFKKNRDADFSDSVGKLMSDLKLLVGQSPAASRP